MSDEIKKIIDELDAHNEAIGAPRRDRDKVQSDARWVQQAREGLTVETLCMMLTDFEFALKKLRQTGGAARDAKQSAEIGKGVEWMRDTPVEALLAFFDRLNDAEPEKLRQAKDVDLHLLRTFALIGFFAVVHAGGIEGKTLPAGRRLS